MDLDELDAILERIARQFDETDKTQPAPVADDVGVQDKAEKETAARGESRERLQVETSERQEKELELLEATEDKIIDWHRNDLYRFEWCFSYLNHFLKNFGFDKGSADFERFMVGYDRKRHALILAVDATHYYKIDCDETNKEVLDPDKAVKIFEVLHPLRLKKAKEALHYYI